MVGHMAMLAGLLCGMFQTGSQNIISTTRAELLSGQHCRPRLAVASTEICHAMHTAQYAWAMSAPKHHICVSIHACRAGTAVSELTLLTVTSCGMHAGQGGKPCKWQAEAPGSAALSGANW